MFIYIICIFFGVRQIEQERDDKLKKQRKAMLEIQQKNGLKELLLEKKIEAQTVILQKTQAELYAVLAAQGDSSAAAKLEVQVKCDASQSFSPPPGSIVCRTSNL